VADVGGGAGTLRIETARDESGEPTITLSGELDLLVVEPLRQAITAALAPGAKRLAFEVSELRFIDSAGLAVLIEASGKVDAVELRAPSPAVRRAVELTSLSDVLRLVS
jgi:anti-sigma B factor antagonist